MELALKRRKHRVNKANGSTYTKGDLLFYCCLLAIPLLQLAIFYFGVNFQSLILMFQKYDGVNGKFIWDTTFDNFHKFFGGGGYETGLIQTNGFWIMVKNSFVVYLLTSLAGTVLAMFFSYYIYKKRTLSTFYKITLFIPTILPGILLVIIYRMFIGEGVPAFLEILSKGNIVINNNIWDGTNNTRLILITAFTVWVSFGSQVLVYTGAMDKIPTEVIEASQLDGAGPMREFFFVIVPYILPTVSTFLIGGLAGIFTAQNNLFSFTYGAANISEQTVGYYLYMLVYGGGKSNYPFASFVGFLFTAVIMPSIIAVRKVVDKVTK